MKKSLLLVLTFSFIFYNPFLALATSFKLDTVHSNVGFTVRHLMVSKVRGNFNNYNGTIEFDKNKKKLVSLTAVIKVKSINTRNKKRDGHLKSPDFFNVAKFPTMKFKSTKITQKGEDITLVGDLTMKGVTKNITLKGTFNGMIEGRGGKQHLGFEAEGSLSRKAFGITWNKVLDQGGVAVGDKVTIILDIEAIER